MNNPLTRRPVVIGIIAVAAVVVAAVGWKHLQEAHGHAHGDAAVLALDNGQRWKTDAPQRAGMQQIRDAAASVEAAFARNELSAEQARAFSEKVNASFGEMVRVCQLPPKADATFHAIMTQLMSGAAALAGNPKSKEAMDAVTSALRQYAEYFDHPGWNRLPEPGV